MGLFGLGLSYFLFSSAAVKCSPNKHTYEESAGSIVGKMSHWWWKEGAMTGANSTKSMFQIGYPQSNLNQYFAPIFAI